MSEYCVRFEGRGGRAALDGSRSGGAGGFRLVAAGASRTRWTFYDTDLRSLARHGFSLSVRRAGGRPEAVLGWSERARSPVLKARDLRAPLPARFSGAPRIPDGPVRERLLPLAAGRPLEPVAVATVSVRSLRLRRARGPAAEVGTLELETWTVRLPGAASEAVRVHAATLRTAGLGHETVVGLARRLEDAYGLRVTTDGIVERILRALHGDAVLDGSPTGKVAQGDTLGTAARRVLSVQLGRLRRHDPGTREGSDPEHLHDMRVATRRLRAALRTYRPALTPSVHERLTRDLRWLGRRLGSVRDVDVLLERFAGSGALPAIVEHLRRRREKARERMIEALRSDRYLRLVSTLDAVCRGWSIEAVPEAALDPVGVHAAAAARAARDRLLRDGDAALAQPEAGRLHRTRIRAKRLRYVLEFHEALGASVFRNRIRRLVALQDHLGAHQDAVVAADEVGRFLGRHAPVLSATDRAGTESRLDDLRRESESLRRRFAGRWVRLRAALTADAFAAALDGMEKKTGTPSRASPDLS